MSLKPGSGASCSIYVPKLELGNEIRDELGNEIRDELGNEITEGHRGPQRNFLDRHRNSAIPNGTALFLSSDTTGSGLIFRYSTALSGFPLCDAVPTVARPLLLTPLLCR